MPHRKLPLVVWSTVLKFCVGNFFDAAPEFKRGLPLLAVCRVWRSIATPVVYSYAFVEYEEKKALRTSRFARNADGGAPAANASVKTNLDLIAAARCARAVRRIEINVVYKTNPFPALRDIIERMNTVAGKWHAVELIVTMHPCTYNYANENMDVSRCSYAIAEVGDALAALMPSIHRLSCREFTKNTVAKSLYGRLAWHYVDQLQTLSSFQLIDLPTDRQFARLRKVRIGDCGGSDLQLPRMVSKELLDINLGNQPPNHSWAPFSTRNDSRVIEFTKLQGLQVVYSAMPEAGGDAVRHGDGHPWKLHFPRLKRLSIKSKGEICPLLEYAVLPPHMESICIDLLSASYQDIADVALPATKALTFVISASSGGDSGGLHVINRLANSASGCESVSLQIADNKLPVAPESITCAVLTHLAIAGLVSVDTMLAFIERMPKLVLLALAMLDSSDIQTDISVPEANKDAIAKPLSTSLRRLVLIYDATRSSPDAEVAVAKYTMLGIRSLACFGVAPVSKDPVLNFVSAYASRYPHLSDIKLAFSVGRRSAYPISDLLVR